MDLNFDLYMNGVVEQARNEIENAGYEQLTTADEVDKVLLPDRLVTVFAGQDKEATQQARDYFEGYAPSSPSFALIKDGKITEMIERHQIEGHDVMDVINQLQGLFDKYCDER